MQNDHTTSKQMSNPHQASLILASLFINILVSFAEKKNSYDLEAKLKGLIINSMLKHN